MNVDVRPCTTKTRQMHRLNLDWRRRTSKSFLWRPNLQKTPKFFLKSETSKVQIRRKASEVLKLLINTGNIFCVQSSRRGTSKAPTRAHQQDQGCNEMKLERETQRAQNNAKDVVEEKV